MQMPRPPTAPIGTRVRLRNGFAPSKSTDRWPMAEQALPDDFREFLRLLNDADVRYLHKRASGRHKDLDDLEHLPED